MMEARVRRTIAGHRMLEAGQPVLVAVSGGVDSMVLLHLLRGLGHPCTVLHADHGLRGAESDADRAFVEEQAGTLGVSFEAVRLDVRRAAQAPGVSVQMAARELRHAWFRERMTALGVPVLATAHHRDDAIETLLINLLRGAGRRGFMGLAPIRDGFVRPLIEVGRADIEAYAREHGVHHREDPSNRDPAYLRNRVRHELLPLLEDLHPGARDNLGRAVAMLRELGGISESALSQELRDLSGPSGLSLEALRSSEHRRALLSAFLEPHPLHPDRWEQLLNAVDTGSTGASFPAREGRWLLDREHLRWVAEAVPPPVIEVSADLVLPPGAPFEMERLTADALPATFRPDEAWLDEDRLTFPLVMRPWRAGDRVRPIGLGGEKLVSDLLIDAKVPLDAKARVRVLESAEALVWVCGHRVAEGFQADRRSRSVVRIRLLAG